MFFKPKQAGGFCSSSHFQLSFPNLQAFGDCSKSTIHIRCCKLKKVTEWETTKTKVGNEMEIYITLTKYNIRHRREEGKPLLVVIT